MKQFLWCFPNQYFGLHSSFLSVCCPVQVIQFALRDYIQYWYYTLSEDESFLLEIRQTLQNALVQFSTRYRARTRTKPRATPL